MDKSYAPKVDVINLANSTVLTPQGEKIRLGQVWQKQTAIMIFLRHFACIACRAHAQQVWQDREKYEKAGGRLVFVGNGQPGFIKRFQEDLGIENAMVLTDPSLETFRAAGFNHGFFYVVKPQSALNAIRLSREGHKQTPYSKEAGTHWQLGGILAVNTKGSILYQYISESVGDFPEVTHIEVISADEKSRKI